MVEARGFWQVHVEDFIPHAPSRGPSLGLPTGRFQAVGRECLHALCQEARSALCEVMAEGVADAASGLAPLGVSGQQAPAEGERQCASERGRPRGQASVGSRQLSTVRGSLSTQSPPHPGNNPNNPGHAEGSAMASQRRCCFLLRAGPGAADSTANPPQGGALDAPSRRRCPQSLPENRGRPT